MTSGKRAHNCQAETNRVMAGCDWDGDDLVTTWGCKRCPRRWEERAPSAQVQAEMSVRTGAAYRETVRKLGGKAPEPSYAVVEAEAEASGTPQTGAYDNLWSAGAAAATIAGERPGKSIAVFRDGVLTRTWRLVAA